MVQSTSYSMVQAFIEKLIVAYLLKKSLAVIEQFFFSKTVWIIANLPLLREQMYLFLLPFIPQGILLIVL
jgi:hypothetical protein